MEKPETGGLPDYGRMEDIMVREGLEQGIVAIIAGGITIVAVLLRLILSENYGRLVKASSSMTEVKKKWLRLLKRKFEKMYEVGIGVHNIPVFVDKYINQRKILGIYISAWESVNGQAFLLCGVIAAGTLLLGIYYKLEQAIILPTVMIALGCMAFIQLVDNFCRLEEKKKQLNRNLIHYFENYSRVKLEPNLGQLVEQEKNLEIDLVLNSTQEEKKEEPLRNEEAAPALAQDVDFIEEDKSVTIQQESRKEKKARKKQEKLYLKQDEKTEEDSLAAMQKRREEKQRQRKQRALEELKTLEANKLKNAENQQTSTESIEFQNTQEIPLPTSEKTKQNNIGLKRQQESVKALQAESAAGQEKLSPEEEIVKNLNLNSLEQIKKTDTKEQDKLIEEVLKEFLE